MASRGAFCRSRLPNVNVNVNASSLAGLRGLVALGLVIQLSTLLLMLAGPVPTRPVPGATNVFHTGTGPNAGVGTPVTPLSKP
jgi:hypothetical protein